MILLLTTLWVKNSHYLSPYCIFLLFLCPAKSVGTWRQGECKPVAKGNSKCGFRKNTRDCKDGTHDYCTKSDKENFEPCSDNRKGLIECGNIYYHMFDA